MIALASVVVVFALYLIGDRSGGSLFGLSLSIGGAGIAAYLVRDAPVSAFGIVFALAAISGFTVELPPGTMRLEQPAIAAVLLAIVAERRPWPKANRTAAPIILGLALLVTTLAVSSAFIAPQPIASLRMVAWYVLSIGSGLMGFLLLRGRSIQVLPWFAGLGAAAGAIGLVLAILFLVVGPSWTYGINAGAGFPRVYAFAREVNLFASFLVATLPFAVERFRLKPSPARAGVLLLITLGFALAVTRGAYLGLAAGLTIQFVALAYWGSPWRRLMLPATVVLAFVLLSALTPAVLLPANRPASSVAATPSPKPSTDTIAYRLVRVGPALDDFATSPLIGLGAESFGQRHLTQSGHPDHIAILAIALPYEGGIVGTTGFAVAAAALLLLLARSLRGAGATPLAAAYLGSLVSLLVAYEATNAIHFALNWLIAGAAAALVADTLQPRGATPAAPGDAAVRAAATRGG